MYRCVRDFDVTKRGSHDSERSCICVLGISMLLKRGSNDSERSCICVLGMSMLLGGKARIVNDRVYVC